ncbi:MAG TPA: ribosome biogenesis GTP-binding protein YihA/YsxC, partial [Acidimicrobiales bacterium]|nr:ribosome biogenesis GTP-binding protein YihA/YsxC [Acidimicrobiales bacterium]
MELTFVTSADRLERLPETRAEVAVVGRSNVGKSSLINALANRKALANVSKTPGRTQLLNCFALPDGATLVDCPGYGYAKVSKAKRADWGAMIERYLTGRDELRMVMVLVDGEVGPTKLDQSILEWLRSEALPHQVIA